ncbi:hypothetical protein ZWY2020_037965 [Hordeum vulgare]|nr:hypothetical protein ZWY2020_037965 [Hordeum vulgare]
MGSRMVTEDVGWGSPTFHKMGREKVLLINELLPFGYELLMCDTDMVWLKNPLPYLARYPSADLLTSSDQVVPTVTDDSLRTGGRLAKEWKDLVISDDKIWDQNAFNDLIHKVFGQPVQGEDELVYSYDGKLKLESYQQVYSAAAIPTLCRACISSFKLEPYVVHTTFQYADEANKNGIGYGFLVKADPGLIGCGLGILELWKEGTYCPLSFLEYTFLENPSLPKQVKDSFLEVRLCNEHSTRCSTANGTNKHRALLLPRNSTEQMLLDVFSSIRISRSYISRLWLMPSEVSLMRCGDEVSNRVKRYTGIWCCVEFREIGHIYYDMYWDDTPGWKPHPPQNREEDHPPWA